MTKKYYLTSDSYDSAVDCGTMADCASASPNLVCYYYDGTTNSRGQLTEVTDRSGYSAFGRDTRGRLITVQKKIHVLGQVREAITRFTYDDMNRAKTVKYPDGEVVTTNFDAFGQTVSLTTNDAVGAYVDQIRYDVFGRVKRIEHHNGVVDTREFDAGPNNHRLNRLKTTGPQGVNTYLNLRYSEYSPRGMIQRIDDERPGEVLPRSNTAQFTYDHLARLTFVDRPGTEVDETYAHDAYGNLTRKHARKADYSPQVVDLDYGTTLRPHQVKSVTVGGQVTALDYDENGNREVGQAQAYSFDQDDRLASVAAGNSAQEFVYDYTGQRVALSFGQGSGIRRYYNQYFETSNDGKMTKHYFLGGTRIASRTVTAPSGTAAIADRAIQFASLPGEFTLLLVLRRDATIAAGAGTLLLVALVALVPGRGRVRLGLRLRPARVVASAIVFAAGTFPLPLSFLPLEGRVWASGGGPSGPIPTATPGVPPATFVHYHLDHLGSTQVVSNGNTGAIEQEVRYTAYGELRARFGSTGSPTGHSYRFQFTGYEEDEFSQLYYAGARFYDDELGLFLNHDPSAQFGSPYSYTGGDPINLIDPTGASAEALLVIGFALAFVTTTVQSAVNGASFGEAVGMGVIAGVYGGLSAPIGAALGGPTGAIQGWLGSYAGAAFDAALLGSGIYSTVRSFSSDQYVAGGVGVVLTALGAYGVTRRYTQAQRTAAAQARSEMLASVVEEGKGFDQRFSGTRIEIGYQRLTLRGAGTHTYLRGAGRYAGAFPSGRSGGSAESVSATSSASSARESKWGLLTPRFEAPDPRLPDLASPAEATQAFYTARSPASVRYTMEAFVAQVEGARLAYNPIVTNSNSFTFQLAEQILGFRPEPVLPAVGADVPLWSPD